MAAQNSTEEEFDPYSSRQCFGSQQNSSDSEDNYAVSLKQESPKRNKRKNFKPRCASNTLYNDFSENAEALNLSEYSENNNISNSRRRKTQSTRKVVTDNRFFPMDLSQKNDSSDSESFNESNSVKNEYEDDNLSSENDSKIPSSFSIHNLSKPHVQKFENQALGSFGEANPGFPYPQLSDMREFAMNTMRELLGIYGLTPDVTESITKQLPIAAFNNGKLLCEVFYSPSSSADKLYCYPYFRVYLQIRRMQLMQIYFIKILRKNFLQRTFEIFLERKLSYFIFLIDNNSSFLIIIIINFD